MTPRLGLEVGCGSVGSQRWGWITEITESHVRRGERWLGRGRRMNGDWMGRARGDGTARSGPRANASLGETGHSRRSLNTGEAKVMVGRRGLAGTTHKVTLKRMARNEGFEVLVHGTGRWWLLAEDYGPGRVWAWSAGDGRQIERIPLFRG